MILLRVQLKLIERNGETDEKKVPKTERDDLCVFLHYKNFLQVCICTGILYLTLI